MFINLNDWARKITLKEGKVKQISIAQVKEVMKIILQDMANMPFAHIADLVKKYSK